MTGSSSVSIISLSPKLLEELRHYFREYRPQKWLFEGETPGEQYSASALVNVLKEAAHRAGIKHRVHVHMPVSYTHLSIIRRLFSRASF